MHLLTSWFQSTHPHGVRLFGINAAHIVEWFQSTHPHEVRPSSVSSSEPSCFNPCTHVGCDKVQGLYIAVYPVSIHAPTWGATENAQVDVPYWEFQSTHPHGVRHGNVPKSFRTCIVSIHAPTWGATSFYNTPS